MTLEWRRTHHWDGSTIPGEDVSTWPVVWGLEDGCMFVHADSIPQAQARRLVFPQVDMRGTILLQTRCSAYRPLSEETTVGLQMESGVNYFGPMMVWSFREDLDRMTSFTQEMPSEAGSWGSMVITPEPEDWVTISTIFSDDKAAWGFVDGELVPTRLTTGEQMQHRDVFLSAGDNLPTEGSGDRLRWSSASIFRLEMGLPK